MKKQMTAIVLLLAGVLGLSSLVRAEGDVGMTFHGILIEPPPCTISDGQQIDVNFGDRVGINKVDGVNFRQDMNYQITCDNAGGNNWVMRLSLNGSTSAFDREALLTDKANLGIRVYQNDKPFTPNTTLKIDRDNPPRLEAVPVKNASAPLTEGAFEAWATLRAEYQ